jgi:hypothetical protein
MECGEDPQFIFSRHHPNETSGSTAMRIQQLWVKFRQSLIDEMAVEEFYVS